MKPNETPSRCAQPEVCRLHVAKDNYEYGSAQNCRLTQNMRFCFIFMDALSDVLCVYSAYGIQKLEPLGLL